MDGLDRAFQEERRFIARCSDVRALLDRMADYRANRNLAIQSGMTRARLRYDDLLEIAEDRVVTLKAEALAPTTVAVQADRQEMEEPHEITLKEVGVPVSLESSATCAAPVPPAAPPPQQKVSFQWSVSPIPPPQPPKRLNRQGAAEVCALLFGGWPRRPTQLPKAAHPLSRPAARAVSATLPPPAATPTPPEKAPPEVGLKSVLPAPPEPAASLVYTGADLARHRAAHALTQRAAAHLLGVAHGTIAKAEMDPTKPVGAALQAGMRRVWGD